MLKISKSIRHGLIAVDYLSSHRGTLVGARKVSADTDVSPDVMAKTLQRLCLAGIVASEQGAHGGYRLARPLDEVSLLELSQAIEGTQDPTPCGGKAGCERSAGCSVAGPVAELGSHITSLLDGISLGTLLGGHQNTRGAAT